MLQPDHADKNACTRQFQFNVGRSEPGHVRVQQLTVYRLHGYLW